LIDTKDSNYILCKRFPYISGLNFTNRSFSIKTEKSWVYIHARKNISTKRLYNHFTGECTIGLNPFDTSKILIIDIDKRSQKKSILTKDILQQLITDFGKPFYYEESDETNIHVYFLLKDYINVSGAKFLEKYYKYKHNYVIEPIYENKAIRIPFSKQYQEKAFNGNSLQITNIKQLVTTFESQNEYICKIPSWLIPFNKEGTAIKKSRDLGNRLSNYDLSISYSYGRGTRHYNQIKIAFYCVNNKMSEQHFRNLCEHLNDGSSKDMKLDVVKRNKIMSSVWEWSNNHFKELKNNNNLITSDFEKYLKTFNFYDVEQFEYDSSNWSKINTVIKYFYKAYKVGKLGGVKEKQFITDCIVLLETINSKRIYDSKTHASYEDSFGNKFKKLDGGTLFNSKFRNDIAKFLKIKNINKVWKFLVKIKAVQAINIKGYTYSYKKFRWAEHFIIHSSSYLLRRMQRHYKQINLKYFKKGTSTYINNYSKYYKSINNVYIFKFPPYKLCLNVFYETHILTDGILSDRLEKVRRWKLSKQGLPNKVPIFI